LLDINMPIRRPVKAIIASAYGEHANLRTAMNTGL
jgi:hypothetical protein